MRFMLYNIRYGTGGKRQWPWSGYLGDSCENLEQIIRFIKGYEPDVVGLVEVDGGSYRTRRRNQAHTIGEALGHYNVYASKYGQKSLARSLPLLNKQGNAFLSRQTITKQTFHFFRKGVKRLVIELELESVTLFLVHLALSHSTRQHQLSDLYALVKGCTKPHIVAGDFNARWGDLEMRLFIAACGLTRAGPPDLPTYPSWAPKQPLDFILHSPTIEVARLHVPPVCFSDHLPLVCDFSIV